MKNPITFLWLTVLGLFPTFLFSQQAMKLKLQLLPDGETWGVYVKPDDSISPSNFTITGTAQVTVVMPKDYAWTELQSVSGTWMSNAVADGPVENPTKSYVSFGLLMDYPQIVYVAGQETLMFKFKRTTACPDSIYLINNATDPFSQLPNTLNSFPPNELSIYDPMGSGFYEYHSNYAPSAWSCHDNDGDTVLNALEDSNGNGIFDAGDASDLNSAEPVVGTSCLKLKLQLLPDSSGWAVMAKPFGGYMPSANAVATTGRVTIVAPNDFEFAGIQNAAGQWALTSTLYGLPSNPNRKYLTFELSANASSIGLSATEETTLFKFDKVGDCPAMLQIMEANIPASLEANEFSGFDPNNFTSNSFEYCGVYARKAWRCAAPGATNPGGTIIIVTGPDSLDAPQTAITDRGSDFSKGTAIGSNGFTASPNPAGDFVNIVLTGHLAEGRNTLTLWDLQGRKHHEIVLENAATKLDLSGLPAGAYLVSLAQNGRVVERKKLVKN